VVVIVVNGVFSFAQELSRSFRRDSFHALPVAGDKLHGWPSRSLVRRFESVEALGSTTVNLYRQDGDNHGQPDGGSGGDTSARPVIGSRDSPDRSVLVEPACPRHGYIGNGFECGVRV
jgi:hypothetical protein